MSSRYKGGGGDDYDYDSPPPSYYSSRVSSSSRSPAHSGSRGGRGAREGDDEEDIYNYEVPTGGGSKKSSSKKKKEKKPSSKPSTPEVRKSTEDRIAEIMARHGASSSPAMSPGGGARASVETLITAASGSAVGDSMVAEEGSSFRDFARSLLQLRASLGDSAVDTSSEDPLRSKSPVPAVTSPAATPPPDNRRNRRSSLNSDSSDISEGDFEAGGYAKRVQQRKKQEREKQQQQQREAEEERAKAMLMAPSSPEPATSPTPSRLDTVPEQPRHYEMQMQDLDDTGGLVRYGSPLSSPYGRQDAAPDSRSPVRDGGGYYDDDEDDYHHRSHGEEEEEEPASPPPGYHHHSRDDDDDERYRSGSESISPLYGGGLPPTDADAAGGLDSRSLDFSTSSPLMREPPATKQPSRGGGGGFGGGSGAGTPSAAHHSSDDEPGGLQLLHLTPLSPLGGTGGSTGGPPLSSLAYSADTQDDDPPLQPFPSSGPLSVPPPSLSAISPPPPAQPPHDTAPLLLSPEPMRAVASPSPSPQHSPVRAPQATAPASLSPQPPPSTYATSLPPQADMAGLARSPPPSSSPAPPPQVSSPMGHMVAPGEAARGGGGGGGGSATPLQQAGFGARSPLGLSSPPASPDRQLQQHSPAHPAGPFQHEAPMYPPRPTTPEPPSPSQDQAPPPPPPPPAPVVSSSEIAQSLRLLKSHVTRVTPDMHGFPGGGQRDQGSGSGQVVMLRGEGGGGGEWGEQRGRPISAWGDGDDVQAQAAEQRRGRTGRAALSSSSHKATGRSKSLGREGRSPARTYDSNNNRRGLASSSSSPSGLAKRRRPSATSAGSTPARHVSSSRPARDTAEQEAEQMEREASLYEWERALQERMLRLELQEKLLARKELAVDQTSRSLQELQGSLEDEIRAAAAAAMGTDTAGGVEDEGAARVEETAMLREELETARNEASALRADLEALRLRWDYISGIDTAIQAAADAAQPPTAALRAVRTAASGAASGAGGPEMVLVNVSDLTALRRDHEAQERLLEGFQRENERLVQQMTELKHQAGRERRDMGREREALNKEINNLRNQLQGVGGGGLHGTDSDRLQAGLRAEAQLRYLEEDIARERKATRERELELRYELDRLRKGKMDAELRAEGMSRAVLEEGDKEVTRLERLLKEERESHASDVKALRDKLRWYAENQELLEHHAATVARQAEEMATLRRELQQARDGRPASGAAPRQQVLESRVKELEKQLVEMEAAMQRRNPDCLASLIRATQGASEGGREAELLSRIQELEQDVQQQKDVAEARLRSLRQEHEKVKLGYEERIKLLADSQHQQAADGAAPASSSSKKSKADASSAGGVGKVKELEKELERVRAFYSKKLKEAERKAETQIRALKRGGVTNAKPAGTGSQPAQRPTAAQGSGGDGAAELAFDDRPVPVAEDGGASSDVAIAQELQRRLEQSEAEVKALRAELQQQDGAARQPQQSSSSSPERKGGAAAGSAGGGGWQQEQVKAVEEAVARAIGRISPPQQQLAEAEGRRELKEEAAAAARGEMEGLRQAHEMLKREMGLKEQQLGGLRDAVGQLRAELGLLRSQHQESRVGFMASGADPHYQALAAQVISLERRAANRERELSEIIETSASKHQLQVLLLRTDYEQRLCEKDEQIRAFREELDSLLEALEALRGRPRGAAPASTASSRPMAIAGRV